MAKVPVFKPKPTEVSKRLVNTIKPGSVFGDWKGIDATVGVFILGGNASSLYPGDFPFVAYVSSGNNGNFDGQVPTNPGVGGMGGVAWRTDALAQAAGSAGADGLVIVTEYLAL
jgi:hypothetical protein